MNDKEFIEKVKQLSDAGDIAITAVNSEYCMAEESYISHNSPVKKGDRLSLVFCSGREILERHKRLKHVFRVESQTVAIDTKNRVVIHAIGGWYTKSDTYVESGSLAVYGIDNMLSFTILKK